MSDRTLSKNNIQQRKQSNLKNTSSTKVRDPQEVKTGVQEDIVDPTRALLDWLVKAQKRKLTYRSAPLILLDPKKRNLNKDRGAQGLGGKTTGIRRRRDRKKLEEPPKRGPVLRLFKCNKTVPKKANAKNQKESQPALRVKTKQKNNESQFRKDISKQNAKSDTRILHQKPVTAKKLQKEGSLSATKLSSKESKTHQPAKRLADINKEKLNLKQFPKNATASDIQHFKTQNQSGPKYNKDGRKIVTPNNDGIGKSDKCQNVETVPGKKYQNIWADSSNKLPRDGVLNKTKIQKNPNAKGSRFQRSWKKPIRPGKRKRKIKVTYARDTNQGFQRESSNQIEQLMKTYRENQVYTRLDRLDRIDKLKLSRMMAKLKPDELERNGKWDFSPAKVENSKKSLLALNKSCILTRSNRLNHGENTNLLCPNTTLSDKEVRNTNNNLNKTEMNASMKEARQSIVKTEKTCNQLESRKKTDDFRFTGKIESPQKQMSIKLLRGAGDNDVVTGVGIKFDQLKYELIGKQNNSNRSRYEKTSKDSKKIVSLKTKKLENKSEKASENGNSRQTIYETNKNYKNKINKKLISEKTEKFKSEKTISGSRLEENKTSGKEVNNKSEKAIILPIHEPTSKNKKAQIKEPSRRVVITRSTSQAEKIIKSKIKHQLHQQTDTTFNENKEKYKLYCRHHNSAADRSQNILQRKQIKVVELEDKLDKEENETPKSNQTLTLGEIARLNQIRKKDTINHIKRIRRDTDKARRQIGNFVNLTLKLSGTEIDRMVRSRIRTRSQILNDFQYDESVLHCSSNEYALKYRDSDMDSICVIPTVNSPGLATASRHMDDISQEQLLRENLKDEIRQTRLSDHTSCDRLMKRPFTADILKQIVPTRTTLMRQQSVLMSNWENNVDSTRRKSIRTISSLLNLNFPNKNLSGQHAGRDFEQDERRKRLHSGVHGERKPFIIPSDTETHCQSGISKKIR